MRTGRQQRFDHVPKESFAARELGARAGIVTAGRRVAGVGLVGMRERLALVHGTLDIESAPGRGTLIQASIPLRRRAPDPAARVS